MPNFSKYFQDEVRRLARKETKIIVEKLQKENVDLRRKLSELRSRVEGMVPGGSKNAPGRDGHEMAGESDGNKDRKRVSSATVRTLRQRLGLTQAEFAKLVGVSGQSVYQWERRDGQLKLRGNTKSAIVEAKSMGSREARRRLAEMGK